MKIKTYLVLSAYSLILAACAGPTIADEPVNVEASLPVDFNFSKQGFKVISTLIDKKKATMATVYGNDIALNAAKTSDPLHAPGLVMALVTWQQQSNRYWYGNKIPGTLLSVEMVTADRKKGEITYALFEGKTLRFKPGISHPEKRISYILDQKPSIMP
ncbi:cytochrome P460 family protein [Mucilaginibacter celer]|nr:cytochrome P460 family protein [Mucilaginibacter celer]